MIDEKTTEQFKEKLNKKKLEIEGELKSNKDFPDHSWLFASIEFPRINQ